MSTRKSAAERAPIETTNLDIYGDPPLPWQRVLDAIDRTPNDEHLTWWLGTVRADGRAHAAGVGGFWHDGYIYFTSSPHARKAQNRAENPSATIAVRLDGIDAVFEGDVERVTDPATLENVVDSALRSISRLLEGPGGRGREPPGTSPPLPCRPSLQAVDARRDHRRDLAGGRLRSFASAPPGPLVGAQGPGSCRRRPG